MRDLGMLTTGNDVLATSDRERVLQAMAECCAERGYAETTVEAVLERAGVEPESFASYFSGKEDCALAAFNKIVSETLARISMANADGSDAIERRTHAARAILELMAGQPSFAKLALVESRQTGSKRMHHAYESAAGVLALMIDRLGKAGGDSAPTARAALGGAEAVIRRELASGRSARLPQLMPDFVYAVLVPFVGQREALRQAKLAAMGAAEEE
jgi:AcrR family transcriptional regulator